MCSNVNPPRISFSDDLGHEDSTQIDHNESTRRDTKFLESDSCDFEFSICNNLNQDESSLADEIFSDGMILPIQIQQNSLYVGSKQQQQQHQQLHSYNPTSSSLPPLPSPSTDIEKKEKLSRSKSFWGFKRSSSLNCDIKKSLSCSLSLLSRSNSTGSVPNSKQAKLKEIHRQEQQKGASSMAATKPYNCSNNYVYTLPQNYSPYRYGGSHHGNGVRISPVLNVKPPPYIAKGTANLFGFGSFFFHGREKKSRK